MTYRSCHVALCDQIYMTCFFNIKTVLPFYVNSINPVFVSFGISPNPIYVLFSDLEKVDHAFVSTRLNYCHHMHTRLFSHKMLQLRT